MTQGSGDSRGMESVAHAGPALVVLTGVLSVVRVNGYLVDMILILIVSGQFWHIRHICLRCGARVARCQDPQALAEHCRRWLWIAHKLRDSRVFQVEFVTLTFGISFLFDRLSIAGWVPWWVPGMLTVALFCLLAASLRAIFVHNQVMPWCPYCRHGDGGEDRSLAPVPVPTGEAR